MFSVSFRLGNIILSQNSFIKVQIRNVTTFNLLNYTLYYTG